MASVNTRSKTKARKRARSSSGTTSPADTGVDDSDSGPPARKKIKTSSELVPGSNFKSKAIAISTRLASNEAKSSKAEDASVTDSVFFRLPRELRDQIYTHVAQKEKHQVLYVNIGLQKGQKPHITATAHDGGLTGTCTQLRREYLEAFAKVYGAGLVEQTELSYGSAQITATRAPVEGVTAIEARIHTFDGSNPLKPTSTLILTFTFIGGPAPTGTLQKLEFSPPAHERSQWYEDKIKEFWQMKDDRNAVRKQAIAAAKGVQWKGFLLCYKHWYEVVIRSRSDR